MADRVCHPGRIGDLENEKRVNSATRRDSVGDKGRMKKKKKELEGDAVNRDDKIYAGVSMLIHWKSDAV